MTSRSTTPTAAEHAHDAERWPPARPSVDEDLRRAADTGAPAGWRPPTGSPTWGGLTRELRTAREPLRLFLRAPRLAATPRGDGGPVVLVPGFGAGPASMAPLAAFLRARGHDARPWSLGRNLGDPEGDRERLVPLVATQVERAGRPVALVGWSLGGVIAREVARVRPDLVRAVVTYGTPAVGGPTYTNVGTTWDEAEQRRILAEVDRLDREQPIAVPVTAILSRRDGIVDWRAQVDVRSVDVRHVEVASSHVGLGLDPDVWQAVAEALAP